MRICYTHFRRFYEETAVRTGRAANHVRSAGVSRADANHLISNGVNINSSLPIRLRSGRAVGRGNF